MFCLPIRFAGLLLLGVAALSPATFAARSKTAADPAAAALNQARQQYEELLKTDHPERLYWLDCLASLQSIPQKYPQSAAIGEARYYAASVQRELYRRFGDPAALDQAVRGFQEMSRQAPRHPLAADAVYQAAELLRREKRDAVAAALEYQRILDDYPDSDPASAARNALAQLKAGGNGHKTKTAPKGPAVLERIRYWSNPDYTRVVIYLDRPATFGQLQRLKVDPQHNRPDRLYLDLQNTRLSAEAARPLRIGDGQLRQVRAGQFTAQKARVVMDIEHIANFQMVSWNDPFRIIIDVQGETKKPAAEAANLEKLRREIDSTARQLMVQPQPGVRRIAIDAGHGGSDPGAVGPHGLVEKDVTLEIARELVKGLTRRGYEVFLTRNADITLPLEERTALANEKKADLFLSIHTNASPKRHAGGVATFVFNNSDDEESLRLAALENNSRVGSEAEGSSYLQMTLASLRKDQQTGQSRDLAGKVQAALVEHLKSKYDGVANLGIREAYFYVLLGAQMPCILIEASFISNPDEEKRLRNSRYRAAVAEGIAVGVERFARNRTAELRRMQANAAP